MIQLERLQLPNDGFFLIKNSVQPLDVCQLLGGLRFEVCNPRPLPLEIGGQLIVLRDEPGDIFLCSKNFLLQSLNIFLEHARVML